VERVDQMSVTPDLVEWDELRRKEEAGRIAGAAMARQLERGGVASGATAAAAVEDSGEHSTAEAAVAPQEFAVGMAAEPTAASAVELFAGVGSVSSAVTVAVFEIVPLVAVTVAAMEIVAFPPFANPPRLQVMVVVPLQP